MLLVSYRCVKCDADFAIGHLHSLSTGDPVIRLCRKSYRECSDIALYTAKRVDSLVRLVITSEEEVVFMPSHMLPLDEPASSLSGAQSRPAKADSSVKHPQPGDVVVGAMSAVRYYDSEPQGG
eukprot:IDg8819t1